ncbi:YaeQ family protein [Thaumasiovibrio subtropicus]|uniref:YaeQ family protein n=1 Tax=Thaumasiovibrio subtropicus TaxID=1891207 RepID=UPI000B35E1DC|nr:YaeQ family protein [Thaumasiovibrio subtropicus]
MALKATIYKAAINLANMDDHVYLDQTLTLAQHPSETQQRMMLRVLAWVMYANEHLQFTKGLSEESEPALWQKSFADEIEVWIDLGLPDEKRMKRAAQKAQQAVLFAYDDNAFGPWWQQHQPKVYSFTNLAIYRVSDEIMDALLQCCERTMQLQFTIQDGQIWLNSGDLSLEVTPEKLQ